MGPYRFCSSCTLDKPSSGYRFGYRFRVGPYRFCSDGNPTTISILLWSYLILSDTHMLVFEGVSFLLSAMDLTYPLPAGTFQSMVFRFPVGGICDCFLEGKLFPCQVPVYIYIQQTEFQRVRCWEKVKNIL